jgi:hypothetical protein
MDDTENLYFISKNSPGVQGCRMIHRNLSDEILQFHGQSFSVTQRRRLTLELIRPFQHSFASKYLTHELSSHFQLDQ